MSNFRQLKADSGRVAANPDVSPGQLKLALFAVPNKCSSERTIVLAASTSNPGWQRQFVEVQHAGRVQTVPTPHRKSVLGQAATGLGTEKDAIVEIVLHDCEHWLVSCRDEDLELGDNLAALGNEAIQFGEAKSLGRGRFRLGRLRRGQIGTEAATHQKDEPFVLIERGALQPITLPASVPGSPVCAVAQNGCAEFSLMLGPKP